jgi:outer membrane protein assembly factor BamB
LSSCSFKRPGVPEFLNRSRQPATQIAVLLAAGLAIGSTSSSDADDWPTFLGPLHTGETRESGIHLDWSAGPPPVVWKQPVGTGYSAPSVLGEQLIVHHRLGGEEIVSSRSTKDGSEQWKYAYTSTFEDPYGYNNGPRCSPALTADRCITLGAGGRLVCVALADGRLIWERDLQKDFQLPDWFFGMGCSPLIDGEQVIVLVGGQPDSGVVAFNISDGAIRWRAGGKSTWDGEPQGPDGPPLRWTADEQVVSYSSPIIATLHGRRHLLCLMRQGLLSLDPESGAENFHYWFRSRSEESVNAARPVVVGNRILLSAAYGVGSVLLEPAADGKSVSEVWKSRNNLQAHWTTPIHVDGFVYGFSGRHQNEGQFRCINLATGNPVWTTDGFDGELSDLSPDRNTGRITDLRTGREIPYPFFGRGSLTRAGDRFVVLGENGTLAAVEVNSQKYVEHGRFQLEEINYPAWAAPVIAHGRMYLRSESWLVSLNLRKDAAEK